jgi:hypothetical protein
MNWDELVYRVTLLAVLLALGWLMLAPFSSHEPLVQFTHAALIA